MIEKVDKLIEAEKFLAGLSPEKRKTFEKEIRSYNIASVFQVRGCGSQGRRCLWDICGKPMIQWVLEAVKGSRYINKIAITTEDKKIRDVIEKLDVLVIPRASYTAKDYPRDYRVGYFKRKKPRSLLHPIPDDGYSTFPYALWHLENMEGYFMDVRVKLAANFPMITSELIDTMIEVAFAIPQARGVLARRFYTNTWYFINYEKSSTVPIFEELFDRQEKFPLCHAFGLDIILTPSQLDSQGGIALPYPISKEMALDVHDEEDLFLANCYMKRRLEGNDE